MNTMEEQTCYYCQSPLKELTHKVHASRTVSACTGTFYCDDAHCARYLLLCAPAPIEMLHITKDMLHSTLDVDEEKIREYMESEGF